MDELNAEDKARMFIESEYEREWFTKVEPIKLTMDLSDLLLVL
jgi:hypothetical protein